jgi:hypothetical protein
VAVEQWLDHIPGKRFDDHKQQRHVDCCPPAGIDCRRKHQRGNRRQQRPDVRNEPKQTCQHAPERCGRYADQPESHSDHHAEAGIHAQLRYEVSAEALACIVHRKCRPVQIGGAKEAYEPVPQVLALHQNENRHDQHDDNGLEGAKDRLDNGPSHREHRRLWPGELDDERLLLRTGRNSRRVGFAPSRRPGWDVDRGGRRLASAEKPRD